MKREMQKPSIIDECKWAKRLAMLFMAITSQKWTGKMPGQE
jgi:hypothetical protein